MFVFRVRGNFLDIDLVTKRAFPRKILSLSSSKSERYEKKILFTIDKKMNSFDEKKKHVNIIFQVRIPS